MALEYLNMDFETRSEIDLTVVGAHIYVRHPSTVVLCMAYRFPGEEEQIWRPREGDPFPQRVVDWVAAGKPVRAFHATFERLVWCFVLARQIGLTVKMAIEQTYCTMTDALAMALPGSLDKCAKAIGAKTEKDKAGHGVMMKMTKPRAARKDEDPRQIYYFDEPEKYEALYKYCKGDVASEIGVHELVPPLSRREQQYYWIDQHINDAGMFVDVDAARKARRLAEEADRRLQIRLRRITDGQVSSSKAYVSMVKWLREQGVETQSVSKDAVANLLKQEALPPAVRDALEVCQKANKSSVAKLTGFVEMTAPDGFHRGAYQFCGAGSTGRFAARGIQLQNIPRKGCKNPGDFLALVRAGTDVETVELLYGDPLNNISGALRGIVRAPDGHVMIDYDWSNIEGRMLAWLAGAEWKLQAFRDFDKGIGEDLYKIAASGIYGCSTSQIDDDKRQVGKCAELACGFQGALGAFKSMAAIYGVQMADSLVKETVDGWRAANPEIVQYWTALEVASKQAVSKPGEKVFARDCTFYRSQRHLWCRLPSGRKLCYPHVDFEEVEAPWGGKHWVVTYYRQHPKTKQWVKDSLYGGLICENITQGSARDVLVESLVRLHRRGVRIALHTHDEIAAIARLNDAPEIRQTMIDVMSTSPKWAPELPLTVAGWTGIRYRKD